MNFCQYCGEKNPDNSKFCFSCGKPLGNFTATAQPSVPVQNEVPYQPPMQEKSYSDPSNQSPVQEQMNYGSPSYPQMQVNYQHPAKVKKSKTPLVATIAIVLILAVAAAVLILTHTICIFHDYSEATCEEAAVCSYCDKQGEEALGHKWKDATCSAPKTCETCGKTEGDVKSHNWVDATCTTPMTCTDCNATEGAATGHYWAGGSCTVPGTCGVCGTVADTAPGHTVGEWEADEVATLVSAGTEFKCCTVCGEELDFRSVSVKDAQVKSDAFNFGHYEFAQWLEEIVDVTVDYNYEVDYEDSFVTYDINSYEHGEGFMMLEFNQVDEITGIIFWFEDSSAAAALAVVVASSIDPNFDQAGAIEAFDTYNEETFSDSGMTVIWTVTEDGYEYAGLAPNNSISAGI